MTLSSPSMSPAQNESLADPRLRTDLARSVGRRIAGDDVEDLVQSVLTEALTSRRLPATAEEIRRFVFAIARQRVVDWYRVHDREQPTELASMTSPELETTAANDLLRWAHASLPVAPSADAPQTLDWMLREGAGETLAEIAATEHVPAAAVRQRVSRLRRFFRERWTKEVAALGLVGLLAIALLAFLATRAPQANAVRPPVSPPPSAPAEETAPLPAPDVSVAPAAPLPAPRSSARPKVRDRADPWVAPAPPSTQHKVLNRADPWGGPGPESTPPRPRDPADPWASPSASARSPELRPDVP